MKKDKKELEQEEEKMNNPEKEKDDIQEQTEEKGEDLLNKDERIEEIEKSYW